MKSFNTTGTCIPDRHYMVDTSSEIEHITQLIDKGNYFTINRSRQYGKTTTMLLLENKLKDRMQVISISFEGIGEEPFATNAAFVRTFIELCSDTFQFTGIEEKDADEWNSLDEFNEDKPFKFLGRKITDLCRKYEIVLMVDEMDKCSDNQVFLNFLGMLRDKYLLGNAGKDFTFKSVILAGVYDVRNLKLKLRPDEERKYNSPWNIAVDFNVDMSFHPEKIATMLNDYENDVHTGMDIKAVSEQLYHYTHGYPYLVSWLCKWIEEQGEREWNADGVKKASKALLKLRTPLFDDIIKNMSCYKGLRNKTEQILTSGKDIPFSLYDEDISVASMFGIVREENGRAVISNILFESCLYDYFGGIWISENNAVSIEKNQFIKEDGHLDMVHVLERFQALMKSEYREEDEKFTESHGRLLFLCFLKPIINGTGFYYVEPQTRSDSRMDIVVTYLDEEFIIELKIWRGDQYRKDGIKQLNGYLESREQKKGYLVSFSFLQKRKYTAGYIDDIKNEDVPGIEEKRIYEVTV